MLNNLNKPVWILLEEKIVSGTDLDTYVFTPLLNGSVDREYKIEEWNFNTANIANSGRLRLNANNQTFYRQLVRARHTTLTVSAAFSAGFFLHTNVAGDSNQSTVHITNSATGTVRCVDLHNSVRMLSNQIELDIYNGAISGLNANNISGLGIDCLTGTSGLGIGTVMRLWVKSQ